MKQTDFLIVGQGIAGTLLAHELDKRGHDFLVVDNHHHDSASLTCAGMYNPVILKRFSPVWQGKDQIQCARQTLATLEEQLRIKLDYPFDILRVFNNDNEKNTWHKKAQLPLLHEFLDTQHHPAPTAHCLAPLGVGKVKYGGRADVKTLLKHYRQYLVNQQRLLADSFDYAQLDIAPTFCQYGDIRAHTVIFCEGYGMKNNPYFNDLPLIGNKGEVLITKIPDLQLTSAIKSAVFIMPLPEWGEDCYFIGATYHWTEKDTQPTESARTSLLEKLSPLLSTDVFNRIEIIEQRAGMRPTVSDRRPLLGRHPQHRHLVVFNGLGTRGVMLGATMAKQLCAHLLDGTALDETVDIQRFYEG